MTFKENLTCRKEAQRRFNSLATHFFREIPDFEYVAAVERQGRGAIHYHLVCAFPWDIREGFDFESLSKANLATKAGQFDQRRHLEVSSNWFNAPTSLRSWWSNLASAARTFGFGRCETYPIASNAQACARYVGAYVGKEFAMREPRDKGLRTVRYALNNRVAHCNFSWIAGPAHTWRIGCSYLSAFLGVDDFTAHLGKRWSWAWRKQISLLGEHYGEKSVGEALASIKPGTPFTERSKVLSSLCRRLALYHKMNLPNHATWEDLQRDVQNFKNAFLYIPSHRLILKPLAPFYSLDLRDSASYANPRGRNDSSESHHKSFPVPFPFP